MPIAVSCSYCEANYQVKDELAGTTIRCRKCSEDILVPARRKNPVSGIRAAAPKSRPAVDEDDAPKSRRRRHETDDDDRPRRRRRRDERESKPNLGLILGIAGGGAALSILLIVIIVIASSSPNQPGPVAQGNLDNRVAQGNVQPVNNDPVPAPIVVKPAQPVENLPLIAAKDQPVIANPNIIVSEPFNKLFFARAPARFVCIGNAPRFGEPDGTYQILNLDTRKVVAKYTSKSDLVQCAISPDGTMLAGVERQHRMADIDVHTPEGLKKVGPVPVYSLFFEFTAAKKLFVCYQQETWKGHQYKIFDPATNKVIVEAPGPNLDGNSPVVLTPDRQYFACLANSSVVVRRLDNFELVRQLPFSSKGRRGPFRFSVHGLDISHDGKLAALLVEDQDKGRIICWSWQTGEEVHDYQLDKQMRPPFGGDHHGPALAWLPDGSGWLAHGRHLIDKATGKELAELEAYTAEWGRSRRFLDPNTLLVAKDLGGPKTLELVALKRDQIDVALKIAQAGGNPNDSRLPAVAAGDLTGVRAITPPAGNLPWKLAIEPAPVKAPAANLPVRAATGDIEQVYVGLDKAAVVSLSATEPSGPRNRVRLESFDLRAGQSLDNVELFQASTQMGGMDHLAMPHTSRFIGDLQPDGRYLVVREPADKKRVDVWALPGAKHVIGLAPFKDQPDGMVHWCGLAGDLLFTANPNRLIAWKLPEGKAVYSLTGNFVPGSFAFSPARKHLAVLAGQNFIVLETAGGQIVGQLPLPAEAANIRVANAAFRPDGKAFAALIPNLGTQPAGFSLEQVLFGFHGPCVFARWNLDTGAVEQALSLQFSPGRLQWLDANHVIAGASILDWKNNDFVAQMQSPSAFEFYHAAFQQAHDLRHWFVMGGRAKPSQLVCQTLPDDESARLAKAIKEKRVEIIYGPGIPIDLVIEGNVSAPAIDKLKANLQRRQNPIVAGSRVTLTVRIQEGSAPSVRVRDIGSTNVTEVPGLSVVCEAILKDDMGELWKRAHKDQSSGGGGVIRADDLTEYFHRPVRNRVDNWVSSLYLPGALFRENGQLIPYPRRITPKGDG